MDAAMPVLSFACAECGEEVSEEGFGLPGFDYGAEVHTEGKGVEELDVTCPDCGKAYVVEISNMFDDFDMKVMDFPEVDVKYSCQDNGYDEDYYDYEEYLKSYVPDDPRERYNHSLYLLDEMVSAAGPLISYPMFQRMLLLQHVAMMEAYLCDRLITLIALEGVRTNLILKHPDLQKQSFPLAAVAGNPNLLAEKTVSFLKAQLYHELDKVEILFSSALGGSPFADGKAKAFLKAVMINRHHCVHRDGKDNHGAVLQDITPQYVAAVREHIRLLVGHIETKFDKDIALIRLPERF